MATISRSKATLSFFGDALEPAELTAALGTQPTHQYRQGSDERAPQRPGSWRLEAEVRIPGDLDAQIHDLLSGLTADASVWKDLTTRFRARVFCGLFMDSANEGVELSPSTLTELGSRGLLLSLDIYDASPG